MLSMTERGIIMKYCSNCGKELADSVAFCSECGAPQQARQAQQTQQAQQAQQAPGAPGGSYQHPAYQQPPMQGYPVQQAPVDSGSFGWAVLGFFIPIVGLILFLVWKDQKPLSSKKAGLGALIGVIATVAFYIIFYALIAAVIGFGMY